MCVTDSTNTRGTASVSSRRSLAVDHCGGLSPSMRWSWYTSERTKIVWKATKNTCENQNGLDTAHKSHLVLHNRRTNKFLPPAVHAPIIIPIYCVLGLVFTAPLVVVCGGLPGEVGTHKCCFLFVASSPLFKQCNKRLGVHVSPSNASLRAPPPPPHPHNMPWASLNDISHTFPECGGLWGQVAWVSRAPTLPPDSRARAGCPSRMIPRFDRLCCGMWRDHPPPPPPPTRAQGMKEGGDVPWGVPGAVGGWLRGPPKGHNRRYDDKHTQARRGARGLVDTHTDTSSTLTHTTTSPTHAHVHREAECTPAVFISVPQGLPLGCEPTRAKASPGFVGPRRRLSRASQPRNNQTSTESLS